MPKEKPKRINYKRGRYKEVDLDVGTIYFGTKQKAICMAYAKTVKTGLEYCKAILDFKGTIDSSGFRIIYYLIGYFFELYLKAFILTKDFAKKECVRKIGHDLKKLYETAKEKGLNLKKEEKELLLHLNEYYVDSGFRYCEEKKEKLRLPNPYYYLDILESSLKDLKRQIYLMGPISR